MPAVRRRFAEDGTLVPELLVSGPMLVRADYFVDSPHMIDGIADIVEPGEHTDLPSEDSEKQAENTVVGRSGIVQGSSESHEDG